MYNRYLAAAAPTAPLHSSAAPPPTAEPHTTQPSAVTVFAGLTRGLSDRLQNLRLDMDTVLVFVIVWFLLNDGDSEPDWELLLTVGVLLLLGL